MGAVQVSTHGSDGDEGLEARTVLLVDDDPDMRLYLRSCLRNLTSPIDRVIEAADGLEALRLIRSETVALVISDMGIPGLDGRRLTRAIRDDAAMRHVSVLLISGEAPTTATGADGFLIKPFNTRQLSAALAALPPRPFTLPR
jgi:CheY-like chemotaxis protein